MEKLPVPAAGTAVDARGAAWSVSHVEPGDGCAVVTLHGLDDANAGHTARLLSPFDRLRPSRAGRPCHAPRHRALAAAARSIALARPAGGLWTAATARMDLLAWQLAPALAVVGGAARVLLADHVGLGKTVEAGLIVAELAARGLAARTLVLTPPGLVAQWTAEIRDRFGIDAVAVDQATLLAAARGLPAGTSPWDLFPCIVASIDLAKRPEVRAAMDGTPFDLLVVDEAHHARPGTDRGALVSALAARTPFVVLVTATPHDGDDEAHRALLAIGAAADDPGITVFRRRRRDTGQARAMARREHRLAVHASPAERRLADGLREYGRDVLGSGNRPAGRLVAGVLERRAASSAAAAARTLARRRALVARSPAGEAAQPALPWDEDEPGDDVEGDEVLGIAGLVGREADLRALDRLCALAADARAAATKARRLARLLARVREPAVVFSEFRDTVDDLATRLGPGNRVAMVHGGLSVAERLEAVAAFTSGRTRLLLATDAAGEGLNLQATCRLVVHVEQPWSPLRLEQRAGRVDRIGQPRAVHVFHLVQPGSIEDVVAARLAGRRARMAAAGRPSTAGATATGGEFARLTRARGLLAGTPGQVLAGSGAPLVSCGPGRTPRGLDALFAVSIVDRTGRLVARGNVAVRATVTGRARHDGNARGRALANLAGDPRVRDAVATAAGLAASGAAASTAAARLGARLARIAAAADADLRALDRPLQVSLFDRRAERAWHLDRARLEARTTRIRLLLARLDDARHPRLLPPRLVAAWTPAPGS
ncbi:MAG: DEAD/DEAH box helicase [Vicinamibacterales bacterium]